MKTTKIVLSLTAALLLLAGCATGSIQPGMSAQDVTAHYGRPDRTVPYGAGTRLQYSGQPFGQTAVMVDLDAAGKVIASQQVLGYQSFLKIETGKWTREDMEREFGRPAKIDRVASWPGDIMTYRWLDGDLDKLLEVYLDSNQVVQRAVQSVEIPIRMNDNS